MNSNPRQKYSISPRDGLPEVEKIILSMSAVDGGASRLTVPKAAGPAFGVDVLIAAMILTLARKGQIEVRVNESDATWNDRAAEAMMASRIEGIAALFYASGVGNATRQNVPLSSGQLISAISSRLGFAETDTPTIAQQAAQPRRTMTLCAFDPKFEHPTALPSLREREDFAANFAKLRRAKVTTAIPDPGSTAFVGVDDRDVGSFIFEIFQNTIQHGRYNEAEAMLDGLRYLRYRVHTGLSEADCLRRANGYPELYSHLQAWFTQRGDRPWRIVEISIGDHGQGVLRHFTARDHRPMPGTAAERAALFTQIVREGLSSNGKRRGAGGGLTIALSATRRLGGFLSVRSDDLRLYASSPAAHAMGLAACEGTFGRVEGSHYSLFVPVEDGAS